MERLPFLDDGVRPLDWVETPVPLPTDVSAALWAPDAAPEATPCRAALVASPVDGGALSAYEAVWLGRIAPRAESAPWLDRPVPLASCWKTAATGPGLWVTCHRFETIMLARLRAAQQLATTRLRPVTHPDNARTYCAASAAYAAAEAAAKR